MGEHLECYHRACGQGQGVLHISAVVPGDADILVSWNFKYLVKRSTRLLVNYINTKKGLRMTEILAPPEV